MIFNPLDHIVGFGWLYHNGWTPKAWEAYCCILHEFNTHGYLESPYPRNYQEILDRYELTNVEFERIMKGLRDLLKQKLAIQAILSGSQQIQEEPKCCRKQQEIEK